MIKCSYKYVSIPKYGNSDKENEDSLSFSKRIGGTLLKFAISDGATESLYSKEWSAILVEHYTKRHFDLANFPNIIGEMAEKWQSSIKSPDELPWYLQEKLGKGAFATFLGITIDLREQTFESIAVGDCVLFHFRNDKLIYSFPVESSDQFNNTPLLISTNSKYQIDFQKLTKYSKGDIVSGDLLILATDALSAWIFKRLDDSIRLLIDLKNFLSHKKRNKKIDWVYNKINNREIKNDDITIILINIE